MSRHKLTRRDALARTGLLAGAAILGQKLGGATVAPNPDTQPQPPFRFCLNTATLRGHKLGLVKEIEVAAKAGYDGIEPWVTSIEEYVKNGGTLSDLKKRLSDSGLAVEGAIGFPEWIVDNDEQRAKGMERAKHEMELVAQIGGRRYAAPPAGATRLPKLDFATVAKRYRALLEVGEQIGVVPQLELWGFSKNLSGLGECAGAVVESGHPKACVLVDVFHLYKGGSDFHGLQLLSGSALQVLHMNDYPADPPREKIDDSYRVYPGDGTAPLTQIVAAFQKTSGQKVLSLELFNRKYWSEDALEVAKTGLAKMKRVAENALR